VAGRSNPDLKNACLPSLRANEIGAAIQKNKINQPNDTEKSKYPKM
jgi:hypothetical protein